MIAMTNALKYYGEPGVFTEKLYLENDALRVPEELLTK